MINMEMPLNLVCGLWGIFVRPRSSCRGRTLEPSVPTLWTRFARLGRNLIVGF